MDGDPFSVVVLEVLAFSVVVLESSRVSSIRGEAATRYFVPQLSWKSHCCDLRHNLAKSARARCKPEQVRLSSASRGLKERGLSYLELVLL
jgi:hypothetical protein